MWPKPRPKRSYHPLDKSVSKGSIWSQRSTPEGAIQTPSSLSRTSKIDVSGLREPKQRELVDWPRPTPRPKLSCHALNTRVGIGSKWSKRPSSKVNVQTFPICRDCPKMSKKSKARELQKGSLCLRLRTSSFSEEYRRYQAYQQALFRTIYLRRHYCFYSVKLPTFGPTKCH